MRKILLTLAGALLFFSNFENLMAQQRLKDFKGGPQKLALIGFATESVEASVEDSIKKQTQKSLSRYSRLAGQAEIQSFKMLSNPGNQYFRTTESSLEPAQQEFLNRIAVDNKVDIIVLGMLKESFEGIEMELQLYDSRIQTNSGIERASFALKNRVTAIEDLSFKIMNYLDRDGFVRPGPQDFLEKPSFLQTKQEKNALSFEDEDSKFFLTPEQLNPTSLAGTISIGGEKTPFWERWWFWTIIFGGMALGGGLGYYFLVYDQPPDRTSIQFTFPSQ
ncbi:MAG: hypothetical protein COV44_01545 [Deltaproteobacteria bacterium CG11_big_fil_rev_8_21_14_0_20_45_16]|nr:MAG: hypothetical protein COV44_01545 [Deltaproteobacteria bacterium CG11_big_fil_rev_8_21_14_0_20_45_16]